MSFKEVSEHKRAAEVAFYNNFILTRTYLHDLKLLEMKTDFIQNKVTAQNLQMCKWVRCDNTKHVFCLHPPLFYFPLDEVIVFTASQVDSSPS